VNWTIVLHAGYLAVVGAVALTIAMQRLERALVK
jgi:hypothetical protein